MEWLMATFLLSIFACICIYIISMVLKVCWLKLYGIRITGTVTEIQSSEIWVRDNFGYMHKEDWHFILAEWRDPWTQQVYVFESHALRSHPTDYPSGSSINLVINPQNPKIYLMETSSGAKWRQY